MDIEENTSPRIQNTSNEARPPVSGLNNKSSEGRNSIGDHKFSFHGSYKQYLGLSLYNLLLTVITLGLYYPWAKCAIRKFLLQETEVDGSRFEWHGTGKEMFRGFIKAYLVFGTLILTINFGPMFLPPSVVLWVIFGAYLLIIAFIPLAIHGMMRYRLSRTSLRGIHFGYRGVLKDFYKKTSLDFLWTILSFGIYNSWLQINMRKYVLKHSKYGNVSAKFTASGGDLFWLTILQSILIMITLYIYIPWAIIRFFKFYVENTLIIQNEKSYQLKTNASGGAYFWTLIKAAFLTVVTLGIAGPIANLMIHKYFTESMSLSGGFNFDIIEQTETAYNDATGDDMADILDLDF
ncbi:MAG: uncharacterized membrane protein YjgN (DUF898 family) [Urechidicola sp.]|jgi:uncharacterized membrane protein YjgN (DUF898 family)